MLADKLRKAVLQAAVQGKLTKQLPTDGNAADLVAEIKKEKERLIKEKKIKKQKPLPPITAEEIPFEIPDNWCWVRLGDLVSILGDGLHGTPRYKENGEYFFINGSNLKEEKIIIKPTTKKVSNDEYEKYKKNLNKNTVLISINGTIGNIAFYNDEKVMLGKSICYFNFLKDINKKYIKYVFSNMYFYEYVNEMATGSTIKNLSLKAMNLFIIPLPTLEEQKRIVEKIEEILTRIEQLKTNEEKLSLLQKNFPDKLKKSLLQAAIQGKLTEQLSTDDNVEDLLAEIRKEKEKLIKEKKIKKQKPLPPITAEEIPFEIPANWRWVRLGDIMIERGQKKPEEKFSYIDIGSINNKENKLGECKILSPEKAPSRARKIVKVGDIIYSTVRPYLLNTCIIDRDIKPIPIVSTGFAVITTNNIDVNRYIFKVLSSPMFNDYANDRENSKGVAYPAINDNKLKMAVIPFPPIEEQKRIVKQLNQLLNNIKNL